MDVKLLALQTLKLGILTVWSFIQEARTLFSSNQLDKSSKNSLIWMES